MHNGTIVSVNFKENFMNVLNESVHKASHQYPYLALGPHLYDYMLHFHEEIEFLYVYKGSMVVTIESENHIVNEGEICILLPNQLHTLVPVGYNEMCVMKMYPSLNLLNIQLQKNIFKIGEEHYDFFKEKITDIIKEHTEKEAGFEIAVVNICNQILLYILRNLPNKMVVNLSLKKYQKSSALLNNVNSFLENNYSINFSLEDIANYCGYTKCYFSRYFKEITGINFNDYCTIFKLKKTTMLLNDKTFNIADAALTCGFNNIRTYNKAFKNFYGKTPSQYRKLMFH